MADKFKTEIDLERSESAGNEDWTVTSSPSQYEPSESWKRFTAKIFGKHYSKDAPSFSSYIKF